MLLVFKAEQRAAKPEERNEAARNKESLVGPVKVKKKMLTLDPCCQRIKKKNQL